MPGPGSYAFACRFHPEMQATIEVVASSTTGAVASTSPSASPTAEPSATTEAAVAAGGGGGGGTTADAGAAETSVATSSSHALESLVGLIVGVILVSVAAALFARTIGGTVRRAG